MCIRDSVMTYNGTIIFTTFFLHTFFHLSNQVVLTIWLHVFCLLTSCLSPYLLTCCPPLSPVKQYIPNKRFCQRLLILVPVVNASLLKQKSLLNFSLCICYLLQSYFPSSRILQDVLVFNYFDFYYCVLINSFLVL